MEKFTLDKLPQKTLAGIDFENAFVYSRFVVTAERLQIFRKLHGKEQSAAIIGRRAGIHPKYRKLFLEVLAALGLLKKRNNLYRNSSLAERYFVRGRSKYWTRLYSAECVKYYEALSVLEDIVKTGRDYRDILGIEQKSDYERLHDDPDWASDFTNMLFHMKEQEAADLAASLNLTGYRSLLDIGGGSGVMSMALVRANPDLKACIFDFEPVCRAARKIIRKERLASRVVTKVGDMSKKIPTGYDVVMFWDIGQLAPGVLKLAYRSLPDKGMLVLGDAFFTERKTQSLNLLTREFISITPRHNTREAVIDRIKSAGFSSVKRRRSRAGRTFITGRKIL